MLEKSGPNSVLPHSVCNREYKKQMKSRFLVGFKQWLLYPTSKNILYVSHKNPKQARFAKHHIKKHHIKKLTTAGKRIQRSLENCVALFWQYEGIGKTSILSTKRADYNTCISSTYHE